MRKILILLFMFSCLLNGEKLFDKYVFTVVGGTHSGLIDKKVIMYDVLNYFGGEELGETTLIMENMVGDILSYELSPGIEPRVMKSLAYTKNFLFFVLNDMYYRDSSEIEGYPSSVMMFKSDEIYYTIILSFQNANFIMLNLELVEKIELRG